jgi:hypothetical protein
MDYTSLVSTVATRLDRVDLSALIPDFIARAEDEIFAKLRATPVRPMQSLATGSILNSTFAAPTDFADAIDLLASDGDTSWRMVRLGLEDDADYYATRSLPYRTQYDSTKIRHYWLVGSTFTLPSAPETPLSYTLRYFAVPQRVASDNASNWIIDNHADVYEFGALMHAARHIRDDELEDRMLDRFSTAIGLMLDAYPERQNPGELRAADAPWSLRGSFDINSGTA